MTPVSVGYGARASTGTEGAETDVAVIISGADVDVAETEGTAGDRTDVSGDLTGLAADIDGVASLKTSGKRSYSGNSLSPGATERKRGIYLY